MSQMSGTCCKPTTRSLHVVRQPHTSICQHTHNIHTNLTVLILCRSFLTVLIFVAQWPVDRRRCQLRATLHRLQLLQNNCLRLRYEKPLEQVEEEEAKEQRSSTSCASAQPDNANLLFDCNQWSAFSDEVFWCLVIHRHIISLTLLSVSARLSRGDPPDQHILLYTETAAQVSRLSDLPTHLEALCKEVLRFVPQHVHDICSMFVEQVLGNVTALRGFENEELLILYDGYRSWFGRTLPQNIQYACDLRTGDERIPERIEWMEAAEMGIKVVYMALCQPRQGFSLVTCFPFRPPEEAVSFHSDGTRCNQHVAPAIQGARDQEQHQYHPRHIERHLLTEHLRNRVRNHDGPDDYTRTQDRAATGGVTASERPHQSLTMPWTAAKSPFNEQEAQNQWRLNMLIMDGHTLRFKFLRHEFLHSINIFRLHVESRHSHGDEVIEGQSKITKCRQALFVFLQMASGKVDTRSSEQDATRSPADDAQGDDTPSDTQRALYRHALCVRLFLRLLNPVLDRGVPLYWNGFVEQDFETDGWHAPTRSEGEHGVIWRLSFTAALDTWVQSNSCLGHPKGKDVSYDSTDGFTSTASSVMNCCGCHLWIQVILIMECLFAQAVKMEETMTRTSQALVNISKGMSWRKLFHVTDAHLQHERELMEQHLKLMMASAFLQQDMTCTPSTCRLALTEHFGKDRVDKHQDLIDTGNLKRLAVTTSQHLDAKRDFFALMMTSEGVGIYTPTHPPHTHTHTLLHPIHVDTQLGNGACHAVTHTPRGSLSHTNTYTH